MVEKSYDWHARPKLEDHTRRKHKVLREYAFEYLRVRCQIPQQQRFRIAIIDGFAGGGRYECGSPGSPIIFLETLREAITAINLQRVDKGLSPIEMECLLICNDGDPSVTELLKSNIAPVEAEISENVSKLHIMVRHMSEAFEDAYPKIKRLLEAGRYRNVIFNLDQCGHSKISLQTLRDIMTTYRSAEVFLTFAIASLLSYLPKGSTNRLTEFGVADEHMLVFEQPLSNQEYMGAAEKAVFETFGSCATYVSPFSIHNPDGWRYWMIHFANSYRARQVYNDTLHSNSSIQAHFGRSGLRMLAFDPRHQRGSLYLFDDAGREDSRDELLEDIPRFVSEVGDAISVNEFYEGIYNETPAHMDEIHGALLDSPDTMILTPDGGERRKASTIKVGDHIKLRQQRSFFPMFIDAKKRISD